MKKIPVFVYFLIVILLGVGLLALAVSKKQDSFTQTEQKLIDMASNLGLDVEKFKTDFKSQAVRDTVDSQRKDALSRLGGSASTPAVFIDGVKVDAVGFEDMASTIQTKLDARTDETIPVSVEVFSDYNCPHCAIFDPVTYQLRQQFGDDISMVHKHLPFLKDSSYTYAYAVEAANLQGFYDDMSSSVYELSRGEGYDYDTVKALIDELNAPETE